MDSVLNRQWDEIDVDWDSPPCTSECCCPLCQQADADEARLLARLAAGGPDAVDLGALAVLASRPWREGEAT